MRPVRDVAAKRGTDRRAMLLLAGAQFIITWDSVAILIALPRIQQTFALQTASLQWVVTAYTVTFGGFMLVGGRAADVYGRIRVLAGGLLAFAASALVGAFATSGAMLVVARLFQGLAGAALVPAAFGLLTGLFPVGQQRNRALAMNALMFAAGSAAGAALGGVLTTYLGWRTVLLGDATLAVAMCFGVCRCVGERRRRVGPTRIPLVSAGLVTGASIAGINALTSVAGGRFELPTAGSLAVGFACAGAFVATERHAVAPLIPIAALRHRSSGFAVAATSMIAANVAGMLVLISLYLQNVARYGPVDSGLLMLAPSVGAATASLGASWLLAATTERTALLAGLCLQTTGDGLLAVVRGRQAGLFCLGGFVFSLGYMTALLAAIVVISRPAQRHEHGTVGGSINAAIELGASLGVASLLAIANISRGATPGAPHLGSGIRVAMLSGLVMVAVAFVAASRITHLDVVACRMRVAPTGEARVADDGGGARPERALAAVPHDWALPGDQSSCLRPIRTDGQLD